MCIYITENVKKEEPSFHSDCRFPIHYNIYALLHPLPAYMSALIHNGDCAFSPLQPPPPPTYTDVHRRPGGLPSRTRDPRQCLDGVGTRHEERD